MEVRKTTCKSAASPSGLPGLSWALNPYRGCSHSCRYCYAQDVTRFEMGRDWGEIVEVKTNFVQMLAQQLRKKPNGTFGLGTVTDPYQPLERDHELSRGCLQELRRACLPVSILSKSDLILRDLDLLAGWKGSEVGISLASLDDAVTGLLEPGAPSPARRLLALKRLVAEGVDTYVMAAPILAGINDSEDSLRDLVHRVAEAGVRRIMWDRFNPKPMAGARLRSSLANRSLVLGKGDALWISKVRDVLREECLATKVELLDAF